MGRERGAALVEFALVVMLLITLVLGICEFGLAFYVQATLGGSAREAAREFALHSNAADATTKAVDAAPGTGLTADQVSFSLATCTAGHDITVTINHPHHFITGFFGSSLNLQATGTMRCNG